MLHVVWVILNLALVVFFFIVCYRAARLLRTNYNLFSVVVFVFGFISFIGTPDRDGAKPRVNKNKTEVWHFAEDRQLMDSCEKHGDVNLALEKGWGVSRNLYIFYRKCSGSLVPSQATSSSSGFVTGTVWMPTRITSNADSKRNMLEYQVTGELRWKLLGTTVYTQFKEYSGKAKAEPDSPF
ncbi:MAG: hypothetical protein MUD08_19130 [Cytophagales bacterium]|jgi:hypothetical protein|nr:hypothetical protein [Cytophagales bacterium]